MLKAILFILISLWSLTPGAFAQDAPFSQWYSNLLVLNPSHAGSAGQSRINLFYHNQWPANIAGFSTYGAAFDQPISKYHFGWGIIITNNRHAAFQKPTIHLAYAYHLKTNRGWNIHLGMKTGLIQEYLITAGLKLEDNTEVLSSGFYRLQFDFGSGISFYNRLVFGGIAVDHINKAPQGYRLTGQNRLNRKYTANLGLYLNLPSQLRCNEYVLIPTVLFQQEGAQQNLQLGVLSQINKVLTGIWFRENLYLDAPAIIFLVGYKTLNTRFAYSCDINSNNKMLRGFATHEVSITRLFNIRDKKKQKTISCPSFLQ